MLYSRYIKRLLDIILSSLGLVFLSPLYLCICIVIKSTSKGPIHFKQSRVGKNNRQFNILKFRTMYIDAPQDCPTHLLTNGAQYITRLGRFLRKTSLDELPQLLNIIKGEMSIVGPRPSLPNQIDLNNLRDENGSSKLTPGLTGLAQINGRDEIAIATKAEYDGKYFEQISFCLDVEILLKTIFNVLKADGIQDVDKR